MAQPKFWLKVHKEYIFDNFDSLLDYLQRYDYLPAGDNADFDDTLDCMIDLADEIQEGKTAEPLYPLTGATEAQFREIRLTAAIILADLKRKNTNHKAIAGLVNLLVRHTSLPILNGLDDFYKIVCGCMMNAAVKSAGFAWEDIAAGQFAPDIFVHKFCNIKFSESAAPGNFFLEGKGLLTVQDGALPALSTVNRHQYVQTPMKPLFVIPDLISLKVPARDWEKTHSFSQLYAESRTALSQMATMTPSPKTGLKTFAKDDMVFIRITKVSGVCILAETIDDRYEHIEGKVRYDSTTQRPNLTTFASGIKAGDLLIADLADGEEFAFDITSSFEETYRDLAARYAGCTLAAVPAGQYRSGDIWITRQGISLGVDNTKIARLSPDEQSDYMQAKESNSPVSMKLYDAPQDFYADVYHTYAEPWDSGESILPDCAPFTRQQAELNLIEYFRDDCRRYIEQEMPEARSGSWLPIPTFYVNVLAAVLSKMLQSGISSSSDRLKYILTLEMLCLLLGRTADKAVFEFEKQYLNRLVAFAHNEDVKAFEADEEIADSPMTARRNRVLSALAGYRRKEELTSKPELRLIREEADVIDDVQKLVTASNNLRDIIDDQELLKIKRTLAAKLGVDDEMTVDMESRTFYGIESIGLEFKKSAVFPPANRRRYQTEVYAPEVQKWAILKAICGFLNTRNGGHLLIGVDDFGYAVGIGSDIDALFKNNHITVADKDNYRNYLQFIIDRGFKVAGTNVKPTDIARSSVDYEFEDDAEGNTILRIKVRPYARGIVSFADTPPQDYGQSYVRLSGRTVVITPELAEQVKTYKAK